MYTVYRNRDGVLIAIPHGNWRHRVAHRDRYVWDATMLGDVRRELVPMILASGVRTRTAFATLARSATTLLERYESGAKA
jgi:hypothetical protein